MCRQGDRASPYLIRTSLRPQKEVPWIAEMTAHDASFCLPAVLFLFSYFTPKPRMPKAVDVSVSRRVCTVLVVRSASGRRDLPSY